MAKKFDITFDCESDDLMPLSSVIHCLVVKIMEIDGEAGFRVVHTRDELLRILPHVNKVVGHNILGFDLALARKLWQITYSVSANGKEDTWAGHPVTFIDTLHLSQYLNPDRLGGHSVEAWAERLTGVPAKVQNEDWSVFTPLMLERCKADVIITEAIYHALLKELEKRSE